MMSFDEKNSLILMILIYFSLLLAFCVLHKTFLPTQDHDDIFLSSFGSFIVLYLRTIHTEPIFGVR